MAVRPCALNMFFAIDYIEHGAPNTTPVCTLGGTSLRVCLRHAWRRTPVAWAWETRLQRWIHRNALAPLQKFYFYFINDIWLRTYSATQLNEVIINLVSTPRIPPDALGSHKECGGSPRPFWSGVGRQRKNFYLLSICGSLFLSIPYSGLQTAIYNH